MTFRMDKLTIKGQEAVVEAQSLATSVGNPEIEGLHLLTALLKDNEGVVVPLLKKMGAPLEKIRSSCESEMQRLPRSSGGRQASVGPTLQKSFEAAASAAEAMKDEFAEKAIIL